MTVRVRVTTKELNGGRYAGRTGKLIQEPNDDVEKAVVQLDDWTPGLDSPDGKLYLRPGEYEVIDTDPDRQARRRDAFKALLDRFYASPDDYDEEVEEDPRPYLRDDDPTPLERYVCVTDHEGRAFFLPTFTDVFSAQARAVEYARDDLFAETPVAIIDLDTGDEWTPQWSSMPFRHHPPVSKAGASNVPVVVVVRDPDASNEYATFNGEVDTYDIDAGHMDLSDPDEFAEWASSHRASADEYEERGLLEVAEFIRSTVDNYDTSGEGEEQIAPAAQGKQEGA